MFKLFSLIMNRNRAEPPTEVERLRAANAKLVGALQLADAYIPSTHVEAWKQVNDALDAAKAA